MASIPGGQFTFFATDNPMNVAVTGAGQSPPPAVPGDFNLNVITGSPGGSYSLPPGYQGVALLSNQGHMVTLAAGDYGVSVTGDGPDTIQAGSGNDTIYGGSSPDSIIGGSGHDLIFGGGGDDTIMGGSGPDTIFGGPGHNTIEAGSGPTTIYGGHGAGPFGDAGSSGQGGDLFGNAFENFPFGIGDGNGLGGDLFAQDGGDGQGTDLFRESLNDLWAGVPGGDHWQQLFNEIEDRFFGPGNGGSGGDVITGGNGPDLIYGSDGPDTITAGSGPTTIFGGGGGDVIAGGSGADLIYGGSDGDTIQGGSGHDTIYGSSGNDLIYGGSGADTIDAGSGNNTIYGGSSADLIGESGPGAHDTVFGFDHAGGDAISFAGENSFTDSFVVATAQQDHGNTTITLPDGSTMTLVGVSHIDSSFFH
ncbi:MAG: calcium-binding protein [Stellaceae bacterium]